DLGCGHGRNALYLASLGHEVTAVDINNEATQRIQMIADEESYNVRAGYYDINVSALPESETFDFILSTVVFMFLDPNQIPAIIQNMQERTAIGGYNLIVCAMDTEEHPCTMPFPFTFEEGELKNYYSNWELIKYNENLGHLHRLDEHGNPIALQFATMLAKKVT
ncbi:MAG: tellurite resistance methyltransferase TehB, partial [Streptococcus thermophilus]|nr:tellurite resistance methyltransferase TehB [Streptococcus thermophilus]